MVKLDLRFLHHMFIYLVRTGGMICVKAHGVGAKVREESRRYLDARRKDLYIIR